MHYRLGFNGPIQEAPCNALRHRIAQVFEQTNCESLAVIFSSDGGNTAQALSLYNFLQELPRPIQFHAAGQVASSAVTVFLGAHKRTCAPFGRFLLHAYDFGFEGRQSPGRIKEAAMQLESDAELAEAIVKKHTDIPPARIKKALRDSTGPIILTPEEAKEYRVVEEVTLLNKTGAAESNVAIWTVGW